MIQDIFLDTRAKVHRLSIHKVLWQALLSAIMLATIGCGHPRQQPPLAEPVTPAPDPDLILGNLYNGTLLRLAANGAISTYANGLEQPAGMVFGPENNLYIADPASDRIQRVAPGGGKALAVYVFQDPFDNPRSIAVGSGGRLIVEAINNNIWWIRPGESRSLLAEVLDTRWGESMDFVMGTDGRLWSANTGIGHNGAVCSLNLNDNKITVLATDIGFPRGIDIGRDGMIYVTDGNGGRILRLNPSQPSAPITIASGLPEVTALRVGPSSGLIHVSYVDPKLGPCVARIVDGQPVIVASGISIGLPWCMAFVPSGMP